ncbi:hypothetical protein DPMN_160708 [Dreissena polymorpha]|uniref:Uncharacterized protein n=1 Tax=Dreissena polymorpha TaxID=45954 RepID=A0A9D4EP07_DREPO|nr:hypothetical protein DPMN_160708 [Dreissena polymorpha]
MLSDVAASVGLSSRTGHNIPQLVGDTSNPVVIKDRKDYLSTLFHHIKNVRSCRSHTPYCDKEFTSTLTFRCQSANLV